MAEHIPDTDDPQAFLEAIKFDAHSPNIVDESDPSHVEKAWWTKYQGDYFVYWEHVESKNNYEMATKCMLGFVAAHDVDSSSMEKAYDDLLLATMTPVESRDKAAGSLSKLMGVKPPTKYKTESKNVREPERPERRSHEVTTSGIDLVRFHARLSKATELGKDTLGELGLWKFEAEPFEDRQQRHLYIVSNRSVDDFYPCIRFDRHKGSWWQKELDYMQQATVRAYSQNNQDYACSLVSGEAGWKRIGLEEIAALTEEIKHAHRSL